MKKILFPILALVLALAVASPALAAGPLHQASGGGTVDWPGGRVTYGFIAQQVDEEGSARGNAQFFHRDIFEYPDHAEVLYLVVDTDTGDAWIGAVITQSEIPGHVGTEIYWRVQDNGEGSKASGPDMVSSIYVGPADTALDKPELPLLEEWTNGNVKVK